MKSFFPWLLICLIACSHQYTADNQTAFHDDGRSKPVVALMSVIDASDAHMSWSLSEEFTTEIQKRFFKNGNLFLINDYALSNQQLLQSNQFTPFGPNLDWLKGVKTRAEFVVFLELIEHCFVAKDTTSNLLIKNSNATTLDLLMRVRVIDLRYNDPKVVLQEMCPLSYSIPKALSKIDYDNHTWGSSSFSVLPMGLAHAQLADTIASRIEEYIQIAKLQ